MTAAVIRGDARALPLPDASVDLIVTSPPYFGLRDYGYAGQIGSEGTPAEWLEALWACTAEWVRVLKPEGSLFVNLGDKYAGSRMDGSSGWASAPLDHDPGKRKLSQLAASQGTLRTTDIDSKGLPSLERQVPDALAAKLTALGVPPAEQAMYAHAIRQDPGWRERLAAVTTREQLDHYTENGVVPDA